MFAEALTKSSRSSRIMLSVVIVAIVAGAAYNWILAPHAAYLQAAQRYDVVAGDVATKHKILRTALQTKKKQLEKLQGGFTELQAQLFSSADAKKFFNNIEVIGNQTNCVIHSINFAASSSLRKEPQESESAGILENTAIVSFVGSYGNIINFFAELLSRPEKVSIRSLAITVPSRAVGTLDCKASFTIYTIENRETPEK